MIKVNFKKLNDKAIAPTYGTEFSAGADLYACLEQSVVINPGESAFVPTGLSMELPRGYVGLIYARSGLACKKGLAPANKVGVIDSDYRGEFIVVLHNHGKEAREIAHGERIAQLVITPVFTPGFTEVEELNDTVRSSGGFGSTGKV